jgi:hypothetical protein
MLRNPFKAWASATARPPDWHFAERSATRLETTTRRPPATSTGRGPKATRGSDSVHLLKCVLEQFGNFGNIATQSSSSNLFGLNRGDDQTFLRIA